jgi:hypothetical protein
LTIGGAVLPTIGKKTLVARNTYCGRSFDFKILHVVAFCRNDQKNEFYSRKNHGQYLLRQKKSKMSVQAR